MVDFTAVRYGLSHAEATVALIGLMVLVVAAIWALQRWIAACPHRPDPWDNEVAAELGRGDCQALCFRCLAPHDASAHFCPDCGAMVGAYTALVPPLYLYSIGPVYRAGTEGTYRPSSFLLVGYIFAAVVYLFWIPFPLGFLALVIYWKKLFENIPAHRPRVEDGPEPAGTGSFDQSTNSDQ